ncbi:MAG: DEAD/DEAH box helicase [Coriobacteriales bacterium]|jgi:superfamily II DNA or RNA helicase|nr:DEAD/DEAH box helicase [Coriobacteriales bacterium]
MDEIRLRPYQSAARGAIQSEWAAGRRRTLAVLPTGTGKTVIFGKVAEDRARMGERVLILAHRAELLSQAADKIAKTTGLGCAVEKADEYSLGSWFSVTVGSVQTMMRGKRLSAFPKDRFGTIIVDEAHHVLSDSYQKVLDHFDAANVLGVTATPDRGDKRNLGQFFDSLAFEYTLPEAIKEGYLCPIKAQTVPLTLDLSAVSLAQGDLKAADLGTALDPYLEQIVDEMVNAGCHQRKTLVFLPLIKTAQKFSEILTRRRFACAEVNGESTDRSDILRRFASGDLNVLCNAMLLTEGYDQPDIDCVVMLRPTKIRSLYCQAIGRGTRISPGKDHLLLLDFLWHTDRHELCHPAHLICESDEVAKKMTESLAGAGCPVDIEVAEAQAKDDVVQQREEALAKQLKEMRSRKRKLVDPLQFEMSIEAEDLANYVPAFGWEMAPPSARQLDALEKYGIHPDSVDCAGLASKLLDRLSSRRAAGLSTPKQIRFLEGRGFKHVGTWEFEAASSMITRYQSNGWRTPAGVDPLSYAPTSQRSEEVYEPWTPAMSY